MCTPFGSRSRGDNGPGNDYDFCLVAPKGMTLFKLGGFCEKLEDALGSGIDIVSEKAMSSDFSKEVMRDRILLYEA